MNKEKSMIRSVCKNGMLRRALKVVAVIGILICHSNTLWAQLENGKVYNFVNVGKGNSLTLNQSMQVYGSATNQSSKAQLWYVQSVNETSFQLRNLSNGKYLQGNNTTSGAWTVTDDAVTLEYTTTDKGYAIRQNGHSNSYGYLHIDGSNNAVSWTYNSNDNTHWTFNEVDVDQSVINNILNVLDNKATYQTALNNLFEDASCSTLKSTYSGYTEEQMKANSYYKQLSATLQDMVLKAMTKNWAEANGDPNKQTWGTDYAKKFRVQLYEPYNEPGAAATALGINAHTNLNNPTGIYADEGDILYIMVKGEIKDGASLYLTSHVGHSRLGGYSEGIELKQGLNIIPCITNSSNFCINYVVHTFDTSDGKRGMKACKRKLSDYSPLTIHIEGGHINGYYNKVGDTLWGEGDNADDWDYCAARATQTDLVILGKYITLQFPLNDADTEGNKGMNYYLTGKKNVEKIIDTWDNIMLWERMLMGLAPVADCEAANTKYKSPYSDKNSIFSFNGEDKNYLMDYSDYYNLHGLSFGVGGNSYMYGSWDHCGYHYNTMNSIIAELPNNAGSHWGPGHEIGHQHQGPLNMRGLTEVTNNLFSNVVLWFYGETTSRYNGTEGALSTVLAAYNSKNGDFFSNNIWAQTHMYYKLFLYYHVLGHNTNFYPRLYEMLRTDPMTIAYEQDGAKCLLHFYKKCCEASGNDLTEFFRAHGFFSAMKDRFVGDYSNANYNMTQEQIDAAIAEVKSKNYPANVAVLFINDATGETIKSHKGDNLDLYGETTVCAEVGSYHTFVNGTKAENYTYALNGEEITMEGNGGIGFAVFNTKGEILAFSDKKTFNISAKTAELLSTDQASVKVLNADQTETIATNIMDGNDAAAKRAVLGELLESAKIVLDCVDETETKVGYYKKDKLTELTTAYNNAKQAYDNNSSNNYTAVYALLLAEYSAVMADDNARIDLVKGSAYRLNNKAYTRRFMSINSGKKVITEVNDLNDAQLWYFVATGTEGKYYLKNKSTGTYAKSIGTSTQLDASATTTADAAEYSMLYMGDGSWAITETTGIHCAESQSYNVVGWTWNNAPASHWYITETEKEPVYVLGEPTTNLTSGKYAIICKSEKGVGVAYYHPEGNPRNYRYDLSMSDVTTGSTIDFNYIWTVDVLENGKVTIKWANDQTKFFPKDADKNKNFSGTEIAELTPEVKTIDGKDYIVLKYDDAIGWIHVNAPGGNPNFSYWPSYGENGTCVKFLFHPIIETNSAEVAVTISKAGYSTIYLPFDAVLPEGLTAYAVTATSATSATMTELEGIKANNGAILKGEPSTKYVLTAGTVNSDWSGNLLEGSVTDTMVSGEAYVLGTVNNVTGFYKAELTNGKFKNNAGRAYLPVAAGARFLSFDFGSETAIDDLETENGNVETVIYDLSGRRVQKAQKGLYIVNGAKVIK